jgi:hypothetical protein
MKRFLSLLVLSGVLLFSLSGCYTYTKEPPPAGAVGPADAIEPEGAVGPANTYEPEGAVGPAGHRRHH